MFRASILLTSAIALAACDPATTLGENEEQAVQTATLYRNGNLMLDLRLHFGSFDAVGEANDYNINNCQMTARLLNANVSQQWVGEGQPNVGFWCEPGPYREDGLVPLSFDAEFPTEVAAKGAP